VKEYQKPEVELVSLIADEMIANNIIDGSTGLEDAEDDW